MTTEQPEPKPSGHPISTLANEETVQVGSPTAPKMTADAGKAADKVAVTGGRRDESKQTQAKADTDEMAQSSFTELQIKFLFDSVRRLADLLAEPDNVRVKAIARQENLLRKSAGAPPPLCRFRRAQNDVPGLVVIAPDSTDVLNGI